MGGLGVDVWCVVCGVWDGGFEMPFFFFGRSGGRGGGGEDVTMKEMRPDAERETGQ